MGKLCMRLRLWSLVCVCVSFVNVMIVVTRAREKARRGNKWW